MAAGIDRCVDVETVLPPRQEIVRTMTGRRVHRSRSRVERDVLAEYPDRVALIERMPEVDALELRAFQPGDRLSEGTPDDPAHRLRQLLGDNDRAAVDVVRAIVVLRVERDRQV